VKRRIIARMSTTHIRFEVPISPECFAEIERLAEQIGMCAGINFSSSMKEN
jgi:hypothetical protein